MLSFQAMLILKTLLPRITLSLAECAADSPKP